MSFISYPEKPDLKSEAEKSVYGRLIDQLPDNAEVYCNVEYFNGKMRRELDFLISIPEFGLVALEVKGGAIGVEGQQWYRWDYISREYVEMPLVHQVDEERRMIMARIDGKITQTPAIAWFVVFTDTDFGPDEATPGFARTQIISKSQLSEIYPLALKELTRMARNYGYSKISQGIIRKEFGSTVMDYSYVVETAKSRAGIVDTMSAQQIYLLELMEDNPRILVKGGPGSGKTILAVEHAVSLTEQGLRVGLICFNRGLGKLLVHRVGQMNNRKHPSFVGNFLDTLGERWLPELMTNMDTDLNKFYTETLPNALLEHTEKLQDHQKFDAWVVDEAQDLQSIHWQILLASLRDPENGIIHAFGDNDQNLFTGGMNLPWFYAIGRLNDNLRSSKTIGRILKAMSESSGEPKGILAGTAPEIVYIDDAEQAETVADQVVDMLVDSYDWQRGQIAVITTRQLHSRQKARQVDIDGYWEEFFADTDVMYTNVNSFKGLERSVVVVAVNGIPNGADAKQKFYVALSRARDDLVLVGTREDLESIQEILVSFNEMDLS